MGTDIEKTNSAALPAVRGEVTLTGFGDVMKFADYLSRARGFVPDVYVGKPESLAAVILTSMELGIGPMEGMRGIHMVKGKPMLDASLLTKLALRAGVTIDYLVSTDAECSLKLTRNGRTHSETWTIADAKRAGLLGNDVWGKYPKRMLQARALSSAIRAWCPDVVGANVYVEGEIPDAAETPRQTTTVPTAEVLEGQVIDGAKSAPVETRESRAEKAKAKAAEQLDAALRDLANRGGQGPLTEWATSHAKLLARTQNGTRERVVNTIRERCLAICAGDSDEAGMLTADILRAAGLATPERTQQDAIEDARDAGF